MQIEMVPGLCVADYRSTGGLFCEDCFVALFQDCCHPQPACMLQVVNDGNDDMTLVVAYGDAQKTVVLTDQQWKEIAASGWSRWLQIIGNVPWESRNTV